MAYGKDVEELMRSGDQSVEQVIDDGERYGRTEEEIAEASAPEVVGSEVVSTETPEAPAEEESVEVPVEPPVEEETPEEEVEEPTETPAEETAAEETPTDEPA